MIAGDAGGSAPEAREERHDVADITDALEVSVGYQHSCATLASGGVVCWGSNEFGQLGNGGAAEPPDGLTPVRVEGL